MQRNICGGGRRRPAAASGSRSVRKQCLPPRRRRPYTAWRYRLRLALGTACNHFAHMLKHSGHLAAIRALCNLGLPGEQLIPAVLEALHRAVPSARNLFDWCDARGNLVRYYFEGPIDFNVARHYFAEYYNRREREAMRGFSDA